MTTIRLTTTMDAPVERCFDLSRSIELHMLSTSKTNERVVDGRYSGLIEKGEHVTWEAVHFGIKQRLTTKIMEMRPYEFFSDAMVKGAFKSMYHEHIFERSRDKTIMKDIFRYEVPYGIMGTIFNTFVLKSYMRQLLEGRNKTIKSAAEGDGWRNIL